MAPKPAAPKGARKAETSTSRRVGRACKACKKSKSKCNDGISDCQRCVTRGIGCEDIDPHSGRSYPRGNPVRLAVLWKDMQQQNVEQQQSAEQQQIAGYPGAWSAEQQQVAGYPSGAWSIQHQQTAEYPSGARSAQPPLSRADTGPPSQFFHSYHSSLADLHVSQDPSSGCIDPRDLVIVIR